MTLLYDINRNPTYRAVQIMRLTLREVAEGKRMLALICGGSGIGKTYLGRQICRKAGIKQVPEERPTNVDALVNFFWAYLRYPVVMLDECDHLLRQETTCNMLK